MAPPTRSLLPLAAIVLIILFFDGGESRYETTMEESSVMDLAEVMKMKDIEPGNMYCCYDNDIGSCNPGTGDESRCNTLCLNHPCGKGGRCKVYGGKRPRQFCHCFC